MARPTIGITSNVGSGDGSEDDARRCFVNVAYVDAVYAAGGLPLVLPPPPESADLALIAELLAPCDGLLFTGGPDLDPAHYGQPLHPQTCVLPPRRDRFELAFFNEADRRELPILAICLGCQVANVGRGGRLVQHVDDLPRLQSVVHHRPDHGSAFHEVRVEPDSLLARVLGTVRLEVNSRHHQVVTREQIGDRLRPVAFAPDGIVEAAEDRSGRFLLAVQWHPEDLVDRPEHCRLFEALVSAAAGQRRG